MKHEKLAKDFVQEFHKSVLETTQQQLAGQNRQWSAKKRTGISSPPTLDFPEMISYREKAEKYHWPGIEVIMEVYENYLREQKQEQEFLVERCHYLQRKNQDANNNAERLHYQMTELLQLKYRLDEERHGHQAAIDYLKRTLQLMR
ncbi:genetic suppressor element 1-like [Limulus polyphemus]|uniref:Genetic suppressor element 1-like n=1 Tax=Limulus polyphemus TaxID=6850 RepID=A0ABM1SBQ4_LIMPO|nr:genetic suppressor element 1-like [Limulus polyphemus]